MFKGTHSDEGFKIFKPVIYHRLKKEIYFNQVCFGEEIKRENHFELLE